MKGVRWKDVVNSQAQKIHIIDDFIKVGENRNGVEVMSKNSEEIHEK